MPETAPAVIPARGSYPVKRGAAVAATAVLPLVLAACGTTPLGRPEPLAAPRVAPVSMESATPEQRKFLEAQEPSLSRLNVVRTFSVNPRLAEAWQPFAYYVLRTSTLPPRDREMLILRIGWLNQSRYEFTQHVRVAKGLGFTDADIERVKAGPDAPGLDAFDAALLHAVDQLRSTSFVDDRVWSVLKSRYDDAQLMDVVVTTGQYNIVSWYLNTLGTPIEDWATPQPMSPN
jgi:alkylhydroperoxidase family enzyme